MVTNQKRPISRRRLFDLDFVDGTLDQVVDDLWARIRADASGWSCVVTPNVDHLVRYARHDGERLVAERALLVLPDGAPVVWASHLCGKPLRRRLTGADLFAAMFPSLTAHRTPTVVVASSAEVATGLQQEYPGAHCIVAPFVESTTDSTFEQFIDHIDAACRAVGARVCVVGISMPKHHAIAAGLRVRWDREGATRQPIVLLLGAAAELYLGIVPRAPAWMQRSGFEWLYRLLREPRRLARRYLVDDLRFIPLVWREWRSERRRRRLRFRRP